MIALTRMAEKVEAGTATKADFDAAWPRAMNGEHHHANTAYHGSLDAAMALHEAVLPGWEWRLRENQAWVWRTATDMQESGEVDDGLTGLPARAWLLAILRALAAGETP